MITIILICNFSQHSNLLSPDGRPMCLAGILEGTGDRPNARSPQGWQHHFFSTWWTWPNWLIYVICRFNLSLYIYIHPLVMTNIAMVKPWPIKIDGLPIKLNMVIFHRYVKQPDGIYRCQIARLHMMHYRYCTHNMTSVYICIIYAILPLIYLHIP